MLKFWLIVLATGAAITSYLFYIDDRDYPTSDDPLLMTVCMFVVYSLLIGGFIGAIIYAYTEPYLSRKIKDSRKK